MAISYHDYASLWISSVILMIFLVVISVSIRLIPFETHSGYVLSSTDASQMQET
jgi:hypothetical protein